MCAIPIDAILPVQYLLKGQNGLCGMDEVNQAIREIG
jgi:hypothetical protein